MFPRWTEINGWQTLSASPNSHQLRSFFISNRSIHDSEDFPSRSPGLEEDLGRCQCHYCLKGNIHQPYFELVLLSIQTLQQYAETSELR